MFAIRLSYPNYDDEKRVLAMTAKNEPVELAKVMSSKAIVGLQKQIQERAGQAKLVLDYITRLIRATRPGDPSAPEFSAQDVVDYGGRARRAGQFLLRAGQAFAAMDGRYSVSFDDVRKAAVPVLRHRINTNFQAQAEGKSSEDLIQQLLAAVGEPEVAKYEKRRK